MKLGLFLLALLFKLDLTLGGDPAGRCPELNDGGKMENWLISSLVGSTVGAGANGGGALEVSNGGLAVGMRLKMDSVVSLTGLLTTFLP